MEIVGDFYKLTPVNEHSTKFDLELLYEIGGKNPRKEFKNAGYGYTLEHAIKAIIMFAINNNYDSLTLKEFLDEYKKQSELLRKSIDSYIQ